MGSKKSQAQSWWQTVPGILTGLAAVITAVTGLIIGLRQISSAPDAAKPFPEKPAVVTVQNDRQPQTGTASPSDPEKTVRELLVAWNQSDRNAALKVAGPSAVDKLFSASSLKVNSKEMTCYPVGKGQRDCQMSHTKGILSVRLIETDQGWWVEGVEY